MLNHRQSPAVNHLLAVAATALALLIHIALSGVLFQKATFLLFLPAVLLAAWLGGLRPGLLATGLSTLAMAYFLLPPEQDLWVAGGDDRLRLTLFFVVGTGISLVCELLRAARRRAELNQQQLAHEVEQRRQAETAEREQRERLHVTLTSIGDAVIATDTQGRITFLNGVAESLTGWAHDEAKGRPLEEVFHIVNEKSRQPAEHPISKVLREERIVGLANHTVLIARDGTERPIGDSASPIRDPQGAITGVVMVFRDITEQRKAELDHAERIRLTALRADISAALALSHEQSPALQQCAEAIVDHLNEADIAEVAFARVWTLNEDENVLELQASAGLYTHLDGAHSRINVGEFKIGRIARNREPHLTNDVPNDPDISDPEWAKREGMAAFAGYPLMVEGKVMGVMALFARTKLSEGILKDLRPIADGIAQFINRKQVEESLRLSEQRYALAEQATNDGVWDWNPQTGDDYLSPRWKAMLGFEEEELANREESFFSRLHPDDMETVNEAVRLHFEEGRPYDVELRLRCKDDSYRWFLSRGEGLTDETGAVVRMVGSITDITERKRTESELRRHKDQLASFFENASIGLHWVDSDGIIKWANRAELEMLGYTAEEYIGHHIADFHVDEDVIADILARLSRGEKLHEYEARLRCKDGSIRIGSINSSVYWEEDRFVHTQCFTQDITERKQAEAKLAEQQAQFLTLAETIPQLAWMAGPDGYIHWYNRRWYEYTGTTPEQMEGWGWQSVHDPEVLPKVLEQWKASIASGEPFEMVFPLRGADGEFRLFLTRVRPQRNREDQVIQWFGTSTDIDEVKRVEAELRRSEQRARFLAQASADFAELTDYKSTLQKVAGIAVPAFADWCAVDLINSDGALQRLAVKHTDQEKVRLAHELMERYPPQPDDPHGVPYVIRSGQSEMVEELTDSLLIEWARDKEHLRIIRELGLRSYICVPMQSKGKTLGVLTFVTAESGRRYNEDDLIAAEDLGRRAAIALENARLYLALQETDRRKDEFLATLAHELRNPLAPIRTGLHVLKLADNEPRMAENARDMMDRQLNHLVRLVDDLLDVSRITRGKLELRKERVELAAVVQNAVEASRPLIDQHGHELIVTLPPDPIFLYADSTRLAQVLLNLLNNAAKYSEKNGRIRLTAMQQKNEIIVSIKDMGIGIPASHLSRIFEMFSQVDSALEKAQGGLGIGLSLVKGLIEMHGGRIEARSDGPGKGSEFRVHLPILTESKATGTEQNETEGDSKPRRSRYRILVVDDNRDSTKWLAKLLEIMGNEVRTAHDGKSGIEAAAEFRPDIILMDIGMPILNGYEAARRIRQEEWGKQPILVALTGWGADDDRKRTRDAGFNRHLVKPVAPAEIEKLLVEMAAI